MTPVLVAFPSCYPHAGLSPSSVLILARPSLHPTIPVPLRIPWSQFHCLLPVLSSAPSPIPLSSASPCPSSNPIPSFNPSPVLLTQSWFWHPGPSPVLLSQCRSWSRYPVLVPVPSRCPGAGPTSVPLSHYLSQTRPALPAPVPPRVPAPGAGPSLCPHPPNWSAPAQGGTSPDAWVPTPERRGPPGRAPPDPRE